MKIKEEKMFCPICETEHVVSIHVEEDVVDIRGEQIHYVAKFCRCDNTDKDNEFMTGGMTDENINSIKKAKEELDKLKSESNLDKQQSEL